MTLNNITDYGLHKFLKILNKLRLFTCPCLLFLQGRYTLSSNLPNGYNTLLKISNELYKNIKLSGIYNLSKYTHTKMVQWKNM